MCRLGSIVIKYVISTSFLTQTLVECLPHVRRCLVFQCIYPKANNTNRGSHWANASQGRQARNRKLKPSRCVRPPKINKRCCGSVQGHATWVWAVREGCLEEISCQGNRNCWLGWEGRKELPRRGQSRPVSSGWTRAHQTGVRTGEMPRDETREWRAFVPHQWKTSFHGLRRYVVDQATISPYDRFLDPDSALGSACAYGKARH